MTAGVAVRDLRWVAQYADGTVVREREFVGSWVAGNWVEHPFLGLDLARVVSFGLEGSRLRVGFSTLDGILGINGRAIELRFILEPTKRPFPLTGRKDLDYRAILHWKAAYDQLGIGGVIYQDGRPVRASLETRGGISAYVIGWEIGGLDDDLGAWEARLTCTIPVDESQPILGLLRMVVEHGLQGQFEWFIAGHPAGAIPTALPPKRAHQVALNFWRAEG